MPELDERRGLWKRYLLATFVVIVVTAAATAVAAFNQVDKIVNAFRAGGVLQLDDELAQADAGKPQTLLLIGSDRRAQGAADADTGARSDTLILVRLDPSKKATALLSLPRDLKVKIPGHGTNKLNAAYSYGGTKLTLQTVKQLTGLQINHVINVDFGGFRDAVDALHCIYTDVDRRYFNLQTGGSEGYAVINVRAGYQKLCGKKALQYVRYRHTDNDLVRAARQQDFIRQAKAQVGVGKLISNEDQLVKIFGKYTHSDIGSREAVLRLLKLVVASAGHPIREVHFTGHVGASYVTASSGDMTKLTQQFLGVQSSPGPRGKPQKRGGKPNRPKKGGNDGLMSLAGMGKDQALQAVSGGVRGLRVFYPTVGVDGSTFQDQPHVYSICGPHSRCWQSYRMVIARDLVGEYYGIQGTMWKDPPIVRNPSEVKEVGGRKLLIFDDGDRVRLVAWQTPDATYWVSNTLLQTLSRSQMIAIARSARPL